MNQELHRVILHALRAHHEPMHESVISSAARILTRPRPTDTDVMSALEALERDGYVTGITRELMGRYWSLTVKGQAKAAEL